MFGIQQPVGICIVPKFCDPIYENLPKEQWSPYRLKNFDMGRPDFNSFHEEKYEIRKDSWIDKEQHGVMGWHHESRYRDGVRLGELPVFQNAPNKKRQRIIARQMFRNMTEQEIDEIVEIARMGISFEDLQVALTGKAVQRPNNGGDTENDTEEEDEGNGEELQDESEIEPEVAGQEHIDSVAKCKEIPDDEEDVDEEIEGVSDTFIQRGEEETEEVVTPKAKVVESDEIKQLRQDLGAYNPGARKPRVMVVADEPEIVQGHAGNLPETKR